MSQNLNELLNTDFYSMIMSLKTTRDKKSGVMEEMEFSKRMLNPLREDKLNSEKTLKDMELMKMSCRISSRKRKHKKEDRGALFRLLQQADSCHLLMTL